MSCQGRSEHCFSLWFEHERLTPRAGLVFTEHFSFAGTLGGHSAQQITPPAERRVPSTRSVMPRPNVARFRTSSTSRATSTDTEAASDDPRAMATESFEAWRARGASSAVDSGRARVVLKNSYKTGGARRASA